MPRVRPIRDVVRARATAGGCLPDRIYRGPRGSTLAYRRWLTIVRFDHPAQQIVLQDYIHAVEDAEARRDRLTRQIEELLPSWSIAPVVKALQAMRGVALVVCGHRRGGSRRLPPLCQHEAADGLSRFGAQRALIREYIRRGITKASNALARRVLIEGAWRERSELPDFRAGCSAAIWIGAVLPHRGMFPRRQALPQ